MQLIGKTKIDFIGMRKFSFVISAIIALIGITGVVQVARNAANMARTSWSVAIVAPMPNLKSKRQAI